MIPAPIKNKIKTSFSKASDSYDDHSSTHQNIADYLIYHCPKNFPPGLILDLGAGTGIVTERLGKFSDIGNIIALDISEKMLSKIKSKNDRYNVICADIEKLPLAQKRFTLIASSTCLQWIAIERIPEILSSLLKTKGVFALAIVLDGTFNELRKLKSELSGNEQNPIPLPDFNSLKNSLNQAKDLTLIRHEKHTFLSTFSSMNDLLKSIKGLGIGETNQEKLNSQKMSILKEKYQSISQETYGNISLNYEIGFFWGERK